MMHKSGRTDTQTPGASSQERYLRDYIEQVQAGLLPTPIASPPVDRAYKKKLTFEEWWRGWHMVEDYLPEAQAERIWKAAQENT